MALAVSRALAFDRRWAPSDGARKGGSEVEFTIALGLGGWIVLILGALAFGVVAQFIGETRLGYEWLVDAIGAGIGALVASEFIVALQTVEPVWDGLAIIPALVGGLVVGLIVEVVTRLASGGTYAAHPAAI
jgi:uncharacterized membrane protein YeaQ/YmgE (transglycosylase-associated protein family)